MVSVFLTQQQIDSGFSDVVLNATKEEVAFYANFVADPNVAETRYGRLPVWSAIEREDAYAKTKIVLSLNPDVNVKNNNGQTPAMVALLKRMQGVGVLFLRHLELDVSATDNQGNDYMKYAVLSRSAKAVYEAAKRGVALNAPDKDGYPPAYWAVKNEDMDVLHALCECGLQRDINNPVYQRVMKQAVLQDRENSTNCWVQAVQDGIFPDKKSYELTQDLPTLLWRIKRMSSKNQLRLNKILGIYAFDENYIKLKSKDVSEVLSHALIEQCRYGQAEDVSLLLSIGVDPNMRDKMGRTPLFCAVNYQGLRQDKKTPAEIAQIAYQKVRVLLEAGANPSLPNVIQHDGKIMADMTPLEQSLYLDRVGISILLIKAGAKMMTFNDAFPLAKTAAIYAKPEAIDVLARSGADLMQADSDGMIPIEHAILNDKPYNIVALRKQLIAQGHQELFDSKTPKGQCLYDLAKGKNPLIIEALNGILSPLTESKQNGHSRGESFDKKVALLSETEKLRLANLAGVEVHFNTFKTIENDGKNVLFKLPSRAENRHTIFRQALVAFKRKQRANILMERAKIKRSSRS